MADKIVQLIDNNGDNIYPVVQHETIPSITMTSTDPGEGSPLAANNFVAVYGGTPLNLDYSLTEQNTGTKWIDGKTIYKKTINFGALPDSSAKSIAHGISNLGWIVDFGGTAKATTGLVVTLPFCATSNIAGQMTLTLDDTDITIITGNDRTAFTESYITLYYTKTS